MDTQQVRLYLHGQLTHKYGILTLWYRVEHDKGPGRGEARGYQQQLGPGDQDQNGEGCPQGAMEGDSWGRGF